MPSPSPFTRGERATLVGVVVLFTIIGFAETAVIAVLPTAAKDLGGIGAFGWLLTGFLAAKIVGLVLAGQYSDNHGARPVLTVGLVLFTIGVVVGGLAPTMTVLVIGRVVTGVGDGLLLTGVYVVIGQVFSDDASPKVQTAIGTSFVVPTLAGPVIAGTVAQLLTWRLSFLGLVPFILVAVVLMLPLLRSAGPAPGQSAHRNSLPYAIAVAAAITVLESVGQRQPPWPVLIAVGAPAFVLLGWGLRGVVPTGTFWMRHGVAAPIALRAIFGGAFFGGTALIPLMMTLQHGYPASLAALPIAAADVMWAAGSWAQARTPKGDDGEYRVRLVRIGFILTALGLLVGAAVAFSPVPGWLMFPGWGVAALGAGMTFATFNVLVLRHTTEADRGFDAAASQLSGSVGQSVTMGIAGVLIAAAAEGSVGFDTAFASVYVGMALMLVFGCAAAGRLRAPVQTPARVLA